MLLSMSGVGNAAQVRGMALDALGEVWRSAAADAKVCGQLSSHFEALLDTKDHEVRPLSLATAAQLRVCIAAWAASVGLVPLLLGGCASPTTPWRDELNAAKCTCMRILP